MRRVRISGLLIAACLLLPAAFSATAAAQGSNSGGKPTLRAVTDPSFVPFEMRNQKTGKMVGFDMDILRHVAKRAGFNYTLREMDFNGIIPALQTGNADLALAGITITKKRAKVVDFSSPYYDSGLRILVPDSDHKIHKLSDLKGKRIGTKIGSTSYDFLHKHFGKRAAIKPYPSSADMYMALMSHSVDAVFYDAPNVAYFARTKGKGRVHTVGRLYQGQKYGIAFKKGSQWVKPTDQALASMKKDGTYARIYKKWFGKQPSKH